MAWPGTFLTGLENALTATGKGIWTFITAAPTAEEMAKFPAPSASTNPLLVLAENTIGSAAQKVRAQVENSLDAVGIITPDKSWPLAIELYGFALTAGVAAHLTSIGLEQLQPLKNIGLSSLAALIGDFAGFSRIAAATIGVLETRVLGQACTYYLQDKHRPVVPDIRDAVIMASKRDITLDQWKRLMGYHGWSMEWVNGMEPGIYTEPRLFELSYAYEDTNLGDAWAKGKLKRRGFSDADVELLFNSLADRVSRTQRSEFYNQAFSYRKDGYITKEEFAAYLDELMLRPSAKQFAIDAAEMAFYHTQTDDLVKIAYNSYVKDVITREEMYEQLIAYGLVPEIASLLCQKADIQKTPKPKAGGKTAATSSSLEARANAVYSYTNQYLDGEITGEQYEEYLLATGIDSNLASISKTLATSRLKA